MKKQLCSLLAVILTVFILLLSACRSMTSSRTGSQISAPDQIQFSCNKAFLDIRNAEGKTAAYVEGNRFTGDIKIKNEGMVGSGPAYRQFRVPYSETYSFSTEKPGLSMYESSTAAYSSFSGDGITEAVWTLDGWQIQTEPCELTFSVHQRLSDPKRAYILHLRFLAGETLRLDRSEGRIAVEGSTGPAELQLYSAQRNATILLSLPAQEGSFTLKTDRLDEGILILETGGQSQELALTWEAQE